MFKEIQLNQSRQVGDGVKSATLFSVTGACGGGSSGGGGGSGTCFWSGCGRPVNSGNNPGSWWLNVANSTLGNNQCLTLACSFRRW